MHQYQYNNTKEAPLPLFFFTKESPDKSGANPSAQRKVGKRNADGFL